jgi:hypothetical protein
MLDLNKPAVDPWVTATKDAGNHWYIRVYTVIFKMMMAHSENGQFSLWFQQMEQSH